MSIARSVQNMPFGNFYFYDKGHEGANFEKKTVFVLIMLFSDLKPTFSLLFWGVFRQAIEFCLVFNADETHSYGATKIRGHGKRILI